jgi:nitroreductase
MHVFDAVDTRLSCRAFLDKPVDPAILRELVERAARSASGSNLQPWVLHMVTGEALAALKEIVAADVAGRDPRHTPAEYPFVPPDIWEPYGERKNHHGAELYGALGIPRTDVEGRLGQYKRNFRLFGAPAALFVSIDKRFDKAQWADLGLFVATVMYLARGYGLDTCPQQSWSRVQKPLYAFLGVPDTMMLYCVVSIGYGDRSQPVNAFRSTRADPAEYTTFIDTPPPGTASSGA